ncbi:hypothetical protein ACKGJO_09270 [Gracilimonas sp. Q87]|uniref:hypothetical protein n=1 Tax=Gracilimonas sp. Q87 TaxID=3384766 RepID=UPI00398410D1
MKRIHSYVRGTLSGAEADKLWIEFLKDPAWLDVLEIEIHLLHAFNNAENDN